MICSNTLMNEKFGISLTRIIQLAVTNPSCFCCRIYIVIGITAAIFVSIPIFVACCLLCSFCPAYKYRHRRGAVYGASKYKQMKLLCRFQVALFTSSIRWCLAACLAGILVSYNDVIVRENNTVQQHTF